MIIYFIRHGITEGNKLDIVNGQMEDPLSSEWILMAKNLWIRLSPSPVDVMFASDLSRTMDTAKFIKESANWNIPVIPDKRLRERFHGKYEWWSQEAMRIERRALWLEYDEFCRQSSEIESPEIILERWNSLYKEHIIWSSYEHIYIVTHGGFMRLVFMELMGLDSQGYFEKYSVIKNCGIVAFEFKKDRVKLLQFNG